MLGVVVVAAGNFFWQLGSSSYYVDEALSIDHSLLPVGGLVHAVNTTEITPWTYFLGLHEWLARVGSQSEWSTRLPSAIAGVALVGCVYWMARAFTDPTPALVAAGLTAISPLVLEFAQQVRVYVFVMLTATAAVALTVRAPEQPRRQTQLLIGGAATAVIALWLHYTAVFIVAPLCVWVACQRLIPPRRRGLFVAGCLLAALIELPVFLEQIHNVPNGGLVGVANLTWTNAVRVLEAPFDGRFTEGVNAWRLVGVIVTVGSVAALIAQGGRWVRHSRLLVALCVTSPLTLLILGLAGRDEVITRYVAVAAPMLLLAVAVATTRLPRLLALALVVLAAAVSLAGVIQSHRTSGFYAPAREAIAYVQAHRVAHDVLMIPSGIGASAPLTYYAQRLLNPIPSSIPAGDQSAALRAIHSRRPIWIITETPPITVSPSALSAYIAGNIRQFGYAPALIRAIRTSTTFLTALVIPRAR